jgi:23S rRNA (guanosine2251-2'-O)-methyltransferase
MSDTRNTIHIYGKHPARQVLNHRPEVVGEIFFANNFSDESLRQLAESVGVTVRSFQPDSPPRSVTERDAHQGVVVKINTDTLTKNRDEFIDELTDPPEMNVVILGELEDPQNVGAIIRSAAAFGFGGVLIPQRRQTQITPAVVKVSAGMAFRIPLVSIGNVNTTLEKLKDAGFWIYGLDEEGDSTLNNQSFDHDVGLVVGNEAEGIREKTKDHCDRVVQIPTRNKIPLNAAAAGAVGCYAVSTNE